MKNFADEYSNIKRDTQMQHAYTFLRKNYSLVQETYRVLTLKFIFIIKQTVIAFDLGFPMYTFIDGIRNIY